MLDEVEKKLDQKFIIFINYPRIIDKIFYFNVIFLN